MLGLTGCAGYHLGAAGGQTARARSIQVKPFLNKTLEPRLADYVMLSLRKNLMQDGTYNEVRGIYREAVPYQRLVFSWAWHSTPERESAGFCSRKSWAKFIPALAASIGCPARYSAPA